VHYCAENVSIRMLFDYVAPVVAVPQPEGFDLMTTTYSTDVPLMASLPFLLMLAAIALFPLCAEAFWSKNRNKLIVALVLSVPTAVYLLQAGMGGSVYDSLLFDYIPFIILLGALFVITGGIFVDGNTGGTPAANAVLLAIGALLASFLGTTGAAMLLIRFLLHSTRSREFRSHTILFFIAVVANCGGMLTPLGDPPLFMMYLRGAPFTWFLRLFPVWLCVNTILLGIYYLIDSYYWRKEKKKQQGLRFTVTVQGALNFLWLFGVVMAVALINPETMPVLQSNHYLMFAREGLIILMALFSIVFTRHITRVSNSFSWGPMVEVAFLFFGIFVTMVPCLLFLKQHAQSLGVTNPAAFYYASGALSSFLDNTPTAVTFYSLALGVGQQATSMVAGIPEQTMAAICCGSVLFGAMTYIGNGPNFMVKTIAEHSNVKIPHFIGYIWKFALPVLLPVYVLVQLLFI